MSDVVRKGLVALGRALVDQERARVIVRPNAPAPGFWFGGGNLVEGIDGDLFLCGRFRDVGDSTTGLGKGSRGLELVIFTSRDGGETWTRVVSFSKSDLGLSPGEVVSIEGAALHRTADGMELFVSTEKLSRSYPAELASFQKPGTGIWSIDRLHAPDVAALSGTKPEPLITSDHPEYLHVKDPVAYTRSDGATVLVFCSHPFNWTSSNSAYCVRQSGAAGFDLPSFRFFPRGFTWDVAATRITDVLSLDASLFGGEGTVQLVFYDGAECLRRHDENPAGVHRPRGYSCEELGGLAFATNDRLDDIERLSIELPMFVSPFGTGSSRYVHTLRTEAGIYATWQQAQADGSQPLVMNMLDWGEVQRILS